MMSETGQLGIADSVKGQLILMQEEADGKRTPLLGKEPMQTTKLNQDQDNSDPLQSIIEEQINAQ